MPELEVEPVLHVEIKNVRPVELADYTQSLNALADEYRRHVVTLDGEFDAAEIRLYVKELRSGSLIADLMAHGPNLLPFVENASSILTFCDYLQRGIKYFLGAKEQRPRSIERVNAENFSKIVNPVAKDSGSQINIGTLNYAPVIQLSSLEANAVQNGARREIERMREPVKGMHEKVLLYFYQARNDLSASQRSKRGNSGVIESLWDSPVKVTFASQDVKSRILRDQENPFKEAYVVDVVVETIGGRPALYKIVDLHEQFDLPEGPDE